MLLSFTQTVLILCIINSQITLKNFIINSQITLKELNVYQYLSIHVTESARFKGNNMYCEDEYDFLFKSSYPFWPEVL